MSEDIEQGLPFRGTEAWSDSMSVIRRETLVVTTILILMTGLFWRTVYHIDVLSFPPESLTDHLVLLALGSVTILMPWLVVRSHLGAGIVGRSLRLTRTHPWFGGDGDTPPAVGFLDGSDVRWLEAGERLEVHTGGLFDDFVLRIRSGSETTTIKTPRWSRSSRSARLAVSALNAGAALADAGMRGGEDPSLIGARQRETSGESLLERAWDSTTPGVISDDVRSGIQQVLGSRDPEMGGESE